MSHHYGQPLAVAVKNGELVIRVGVHVLAHAVTYADWANPFNEQRDDYGRTFAIIDAGEFARDVMHAMQREREDGSSPLSDFLDAMTQAALEDGSMGCDEADWIPHGQTLASETWAKGQP